MKLSLDLKTAKDAFAKGDYLNRSLMVPYAAMAALFLAVLIWIMFSAPANFPKERRITIEDGMSLAQVSEYLEESNIIRSTFLFELITILRAGDGGVLAGEYFFNKSFSAIGVSYRLTHGMFGLEPIRVTIPEGSTISDIANIFSEKFPEFDSLAFLSMAGGMNGYLFPDTYLFLPNVEPRQVIKEMRNTFDRRIKEIEKEINVSGRPLEDIVTMASIIEKEATTVEDKNLVSGVLWNRIDIDMPLQVDAVFEYINGKNTYELTLDDLDIDSPYNTYRYKGLPPTPIANPGLDSLRAAAVPESSEYLFYLSDRSGKIYYARDFEEHKKNKRLYLDS